MTGTDPFALWVFIGLTALAAGVAFWPRSTSKDGAGVFTFAGAFVTFLAITGVAWFYTATN